MKEAVGESSMTIITIVLVAGVVAAVATILSTLLGNQKNKTLCDDAGYYWVDGACQDDKGNPVDLS